MVESLLSTYVDGELGAQQLGRVEEHLAQCGACAQQVCELQALQSAMSAESLYHSAPGTLRKRLANVVMISKPVSALHQPVTAKTLVVVLFGLALTVGIVWGGWAAWHGQSGPNIAQLSVQAQIQADQSQHSCDIRSSDPGLVKGWLQGRVDEGTPVKNLASHGYTLKGARLEQLGSSLVTVLVYTDGTHTVNLYLWPTHCKGEDSACPVFVQGYRLMSWHQDGVTCCAVSDLSCEQLEVFKVIVQSPNQK